MKTAARPAKKWKMYVIHHSHTDIGYTERQEKIEQYQVDYIRQAIEAADLIRSGDKPHWQGFKWTCETFWAVEKFWAGASDEWKEKFVGALKRGDIELSGTYLNMTELPDYELLRNNHLKAAKFAAEHGVVLDSAMTADINGYSWGYAQSLLDAGIEHLLSAIHTHHGMYATGRKQYPFYWEAPSGKRLLVWSGEHYMLGNDLGLSPGGVLSYTIRDEFNGSALADNHWEVAEHRIMRYFRQLEKEDYPFDFALVNVMGLLRDNASPNGGVAEFIQEWNAKFSDVVEIEMTTLSRFFAEVKKQPVEKIPVYTGDWPDWWTDGVASTAMHTQIYRDAQRTLRVVKQLDPRCEVVEPQAIEQAEHQLTMYAEHTWGYHSSVYEPWHPMVQALAVRKEAYAAEASRLVFTALDRVLQAQGEALLAPGRPFRFKAVNPFDYPVEDVAYMYLDGWEPPLFKNGIEVVLEQTGEVCGHQTDTVSRGFQIAVPVKLQPGEERIFLLRNAEGGQESTASSSRLKGNDQVYDMEDLLVLAAQEQRPALMITETGIESPYVRISWREGEGIHSWYDKRSQREMMDKDSEYGAFTPIYEVTPASGVAQMAEVRRRMGRNRKGVDVNRSSGRLAGVAEIANGKIYGVVELIYKVEGMSYFSLFLKVYAGSPRVDVSVRMHKDSVWEPENVYISLPLRIGAAPEQLWLEKAGALVRPGVDQLPGTLLDYYSIQEGYAFTADADTLSVATPDTPLVQLGPLAHGRRKVNGQQSEGEFKQMYAWVLTNYWETNFKATLGGYYEFRFMVQWHKGAETAWEAIQRCHAANTGVLCFRLANS